MDLEEEGARVKGAGLDDLKGSGSEIWFEGSSLGFDSTFDSSSSSSGDSIQTWVSTCLPDLKEIMAFTFA